MTSHVGRLYSLAGALLLFFVVWAAIAAHPWSAAAAKPDPRIARLDAREQRLRDRSVRVKRVLDRRYAAYRVALARRQREIARARAQIRARVAAQPVAAAAPAATYSAPRVVSVPPVTSTRTS